MRVLIVEDEAKLARIVQRGLRAAGHAADVAGRGEDALWMAAATGYSAILLDVMLPGIDGVETCRRLRAGGIRTPVLMLTARDAVTDRVAGLDGGADDYLVKPFELDELLARLRALRRRHEGRTRPLLQVADLTLDPATREVMRAGRPVLLSAREFAVLQALLERPGAIVSRAQLEDRLYGWGEELESNAISVYMHQLRRKLGDDLLHTVRGLGYYCGPAKAA